MLEGAKSIGAGAATIASAGAAIGIGNVFSSLIHSLAPQKVNYAQNLGYLISTKIYTHKSYIRIYKGIENFFGAIIFTFLFVQLLEAVFLCVLLATDCSIWEQLSSAIRPSLVQYMAPIGDPDLTLSLGPVGSTSHDNVDWNDWNDEIVKFLDVMKPEDLELLQEDLAQTREEIAVIKQKLAPFIPELPDLNLEPGVRPPKLPDLNETFNQEQIERIHILLKELFRLNDKRGRALHTLSIYFHKRKQLWEIYKKYKNLSVFREDIRKRKRS